MSIHFQTGKKRTDGEPYTTLREIRRSTDPEVRKAHNNRPYYGILLGVDHPGGTINLGDQVLVIRRNQIGDSPLIAMCIKAVLYGSIALFGYSFAKKVNL